MQLQYLQAPTRISLIFRPDLPGERTFEVAEDIVVTLSKGQLTDLASIPKWGWSIFTPIDKAFIGDLIHDALWTQKASEIMHFNNSPYEARLFADNERLLWRNHLVPNKKFKNYLTHQIIRKIGGFYYSRQLTIPN